MTFKEFEIQYALGLLDENILIGLLKKTKAKKILTILSNDKNWYVRYWVANNINTPTEVLEKLSNNENKYIRLNIARNTSTPISILEKLSKDEYWWVRDKVVENPNWRDRE